MIFLIEYDRAAGRLLQNRAFRDEASVEAQSERLKLELTLNQQGIEHEVVLLQAATEESLRKTHRRYFENMTELLTRKAG